MRDRHHGQSKGRPWFEIKNAAGAGEPAQVFIYEEIDDFWGLSANDFVQDLAALDVDAIDLHINSPGGSVFDGHAIYNALRSHKATVTTYIDGIAASIASEIALAGDKRIMARNARFMIHELEGVVAGRATKLRKMADVMEKINDDLADLYAATTGKDVAAMRAAMEEESWYTANEALELGFVDELGPEMKMAACAHFDFKALGFKHPPADLAADENENGDEEESVEDVHEDPAAGAGDTPLTMDATKVAQALRARFEEV